MGDCGAPGSAVCWKVRECVGVCDGAVVGGGDVEHREPKTGRILLQMSFLYPSSSHCFTPSPSQMNKTDLALSPHPTRSTSICKMSVFMPPETILLHVWGYFYLLRSGLLSPRSLVLTAELSKSVIVLCSEPCFACN